MGLQEELIDRRIVDADSHVSEPPDLWTSRLPSSMADIAPRTVIDRRGEMRWKVGSRWLTTETAYAGAGWKEFPPSHPPTLEECDQAAFYPKDRLARLDEVGIHPQVQDPNPNGFFSATVPVETGPA